MKVVKHCAYCSTTTYNLLPAVLVTPLYTIKGHPCFIAGNRQGFRLSFKFWTLHLGVEIHYDK